MITLGELKFVLPPPNVPACWNASLERSVKVRARLSRSGRVLPWIGVQGWSGFGSAESRRVPTSIQFFETLPKGPGLRCAESFRHRGLIAGERGPRAWRWRRAGRA